MTENKTNIPVPDGTEVTFRHAGQLITFVIEYRWVSKENLFTARFVKAKKISSPPPGR